MPYERFKQVNTELAQLKEWREKQLNEQKSRQEKEMAEQQKWQQLYEQRENELKAERLNNTKMQVALQKGLPAELIGRLQGDSEEALAKDADILLQFVTKPASAPGVPPANRNSQPAKLDIANMTPDEIRKNAAKLYGQAANRS